MTVTFTDAVGVGVNAAYDVLLEGEPLARISHSGYVGSPNRWTLYDKARNVLFTGVPSIAEAKRQALEFAAAGKIPTAAEAFENARNAAVATRRAMAEHAFGRQMARLARELAAGSNSAREELEALLARIERCAQGEEKMPSVLVNTHHAPNLPRVPEPSATPKP